MATPRNVAYTGAAGSTLYIGKAAPAAGPRFSNVTLNSSDAAKPYTTPGNAVSIVLHGSGGGQASGQGNTYIADLAGGLEYSTYTQFRWCEVRTYSLDVTEVRPFDNQGARADSSRRESYWMGWTDGPDAGQLRLYTEHALDVLMARLAASPLSFSPTKWYLSGGSMGAWGTMTYGVRRGNRFAALYPDRPRWRYNNSGGVSMPSWTSSNSAYTTANAPALVADDGGGSSAAHLDLISYVGNSANAVIPWIGWCVGRRDGYTPFSDHVAAVAAMRAAKRGFAFAWNDGDHSSGSIMSQITATYPMGTFELGKGYPLFTNHSGDKDPAVDLVGGINIGLKFRNVAESAGAWSCEVTSTVGAVTVNVEPKSAIFTTPVAAKNVVIPAANTWVSVSF